MAIQVSNTTKAIEQVDFEMAPPLVSLSRTDRARIAKDTLDKLQAGWYESQEGSRVILEDDLRFCNDNSILYTEDDLQNADRSVSPIYEQDSTWCTKIEVRHCSTLQVAQFLVAEMGENHVGVLNFASAKNPGGGFLGGAQAQEESIARSSSLYLSLTQARIFNGFYDYNRHGEKGIYSHRIIYSPRVTIFKDDNGELLSSPYHVGIVTVPAPNAGVMKDPEAIRNAMTERVRRLLHVFKANGHDSLVLGAFGCGVFKNNPLDVAVIFRQHLQSNAYKNSFKRIIFAVLNAEMCQVFEQVFAATDFNQIQQQVIAISLNSSDNKRYSYNNGNKQHKKRAKQKRIRKNDVEQLQDYDAQEYDDQ